MSIFNDPFSGPFSSPFGSPFSNPFGSSGMSDLDKVKREIENAKIRLAATGHADLAQTPEKGSLLTKVLGTLLKPTHGTFNALREFTQPDYGATPGVFDPVAAYVRGFKGEEKSTGKDFAKSLGITDKRLFNKDWAPSPAGIVGLGMEILNPTDPLNWIGLGLGKSALSAGKKGSELLPHAFGDDVAKRVEEIIGRDLDELSATSVGELAYKLSTKAKPEQRQELMSLIKQGMESSGTTTRTKIPGASETRPIVTRVSTPLMFGNKPLGEIPIPFTQGIVTGVGKAKQAFFNTSVGDTLGRKFSTTYVPRTMSNSVILRAITGEITPGDPRWDNAVNKLVGAGSKSADKVSSYFETKMGSEAYQEVRGELHKVFERARWKEDDFKEEVKEIFKGLSLEERKKIMNHAALGTPLDTVDERLHGALKRFIAWRESIIKEYKGMGVSIRELENYVPYIAVGGKLTKEEGEVIKRMFGRQVTRIPKDQKNTATILAGGLDPHIHERSLGGTPSEINRVLGREWLTEDAALAMALRGTRFIKAKEVTVFLEGLLAKYGLTLEDIQKLKGATAGQSGINLPKAPNIQDALSSYGVDDIMALRDLPEGYGLFQVKTNVDGSINLNPVRDISKATNVYALPQEFANVFNEYVDLYFNPIATNGVASLFDAATSAFRKYAYMWNWGHIPRDFLSNVYNAYLGNVRSPQPYFESARLVDFVNHVGKVDEFIYVPSVGKYLSGEDLFETAKRLGVIDTSAALGETAQSIKNYMDGRSWLNPAKYSNAYTNMMIGLTRRVDNFSRFAMFIDGLNKGMKPAEAAIHVKKFLFDYFDLTPFERKWMRRIIPFYTWLRKNIPLQLEQLVKEPGKYANTSKTLEALKDEDQPDSSMLPDYIAEGAGFKLGNRYIMPNLPFADLQKFQFTTENFRESLSNINPILRAPVEMAFNQEAFTGMPLEWYEGERTNIPILGQLIEGAPTIPKRTVGHLFNQIPILRNTDIMFDEDNPRRLAKLYSFLGAPPQYPLEAVDKAFTYEERDRLRAIIRMLKDQGIYIPTIRELD